MSKAHYIYNLIEQWKEIYNGLDKRTTEAKEVKNTIYDLSILIGLI